MKPFLFILILLTVYGSNVDGQSGRAAGTPPNAASSESDRSIKEMFDEANEYTRVKFAEYEQKKVPYSEQLRIKTEGERKQLAAKYAAIAAARKPDEQNDIYFTGMLYWISENLEGAATWLSLFVNEPSGAADRKQNSRAILVFVNSKLGSTQKAEKWLTEYEKIGPTKPSELWRMNAEIAKAFRAMKDVAATEKYAKAGYEIAKELIADPALRINPLDAALDTGMLLFEARDAQGKTAEADAALDDMRQTAASIKNASFYYYAADKLILYRIETGRKPLAMETYLESLIQAGKDIAVRTGRNEAIDKLKNRKKHYDLIGEPAPDLINIDQWFPGEATTLRSLKGKVVLLDFWATWCGPCFDAFPHLREWHQDLSDKGLVILGITRYYGNAEGFSVDEPSEVNFLKRFRQKYALPYDFLITKDSRLHSLYGAGNLPTAALIDRTGRVRYLETGSSPSRIEDMRMMMLRLLDEK